MSRLTDARRSRRRRSGASASRRYWVIDARGNGGAIAVNRLVAAGAAPSWTTDADRRRAASATQPGSLVVPYVKTAEPVVATIARELGLRVDGVKGKLPANAAADRARARRRSTSRGSRTSTKAGRAGCSSSTSSRSRRSPTPTSAPAICARSSTRSSCPTRRRIGSSSGIRRTPCRPSTPAG